MNVVWNFPNGTTQFTQSSVLSSIPFVMKRTHSFAHSLIGSFIHSFTPLTHLLVRRLTPSAHLSAVIEAFEFSSTTDTSE